MGDRKPSSKEGAVGNEPFYMLPKQKRVPASTLNRLSDDSCISHFSSESLAKLQDEKAADAVNQRKSMRSDRLLDFSSKPEKKM